MRFIASKMAELSWGSNFSAASPAMPAVPFPLNPAMNAEIARLQKQVAWQVKRTDAILAAIKQTSDAEHFGIPLEPDEEGE